MNRRAFLAATAAAAAAGCGGGGGEETTTATTATTQPTTTAESTTTTAERTTTAPAGTLRGVSLSPRSYEGDDFTAFFELVREAGLHVRWAGDWADLGTEGGAPSVVVSLAEQYGYEPIIETGVYSVNNGEMFRPLDGETGQEFVETLADFAGRTGVPYLGVGVEVNAHFDEDPEGFETFVGLFAEVYDAVKAASPETRVYPGFQLEWTKGLRGGLFGGENDPDAAQWDLVDRFPMADLLAFTTYPGLIYRDPAEVPADYYETAAERAGKPVAITETGWTATDHVEGWESTDAEQVEFVSRLFELTGDVDLALLLWAWVYGQTDQTAFQGMGLRRPDGSPRPAWDRWVAGP